MQASEKQTFFLDQVETDVGNPQSITLAPQEMSHVIYSIPEALQTPILLIQESNQSAQVFVDVVYKTTEIESQQKLDQFKWPNSRYMTVSSNANYNSSYNASHRQYFRRC
jgi:hypothetical protein